MPIRPVALALALLVLAAAPPTTHVPLPGRAPTTAVLAPPVEGPVVAPFDAPARYGPGHRGVDLAARPGTPVRASAAGRVSFVGVVVGALWVTVDHGLLRTTVGPLAGATVVRGQSVGRGDELGTSGHAHGRAAVHWSARRGDTYVDPLTVGRHVATLLPASAGDHPPATWPRARVR